MTQVAHRFGRSGFGDSPADYAHARPRYPQPLYETLIGRCGLGPGRRVFEIGPGTGTATSALLATGAGPLHAIEPDPRLAADLRRSLPTNALTIDQTPFQHATMPAEAFDLGVAATSFHWVRQKPGLRKAHDWLKPGGWWAMWWTHFGSGADDPFQYATIHLFAAIQPPTTTPHPRPPFDLDRPARLRDLASAGFTNTRAEAWQSSERYDTARLLALYRSLSVIRALTPSAQADFLAGIADIATRDFGGAVERRFTTTLYTAQRPPPRSPPDPSPATADVRHP
jgi:SAM-dependent methyltransferase